ncbi:hypothetical protein SCHPADRAFT_896790 [Schizopora paradoxa]|uniref:Uncharacterized protein n=1 Tax=Schizopora paradoxa TaxID=27342 RepID=A0A0H2QYV6_9AGAM|nr:hypothetical protein SCHPADRAFT_896790 [Schizopora paradoxa]
MSVTMQERRDASRERVRGFATVMNVEHEPPRTKKFLPFEKEARKNLRLKRWWWRKTSSTKNPSTAVAGEEHESRSNDGASSGDLNLKEKLIWDVWLRLEAEEGSRVDGDERLAKRDAANLMPEEPKAGSRQPAELFGPRQVSAGFRGPNRVRTLTRTEPPGPVRVRHFLKIPNRFRFGSANFQLNRPRTELRQPYTGPDSAQVEIYCLYVHTKFEAI